jgi:branched-chain amino acid transport system substrate-binding protein
MLDVLRGRRRRLRGVVAALAAGIGLYAVCAYALAGASASAAGGCGTITTFVNYVCGKAGSANPSLSPALIGWANDQGGTIISTGPEATAASQLAVNWVNKYAGGISGHPLKLATCLIKNSEEEGLACGDQFLANKNIHVIDYGSTEIGGATIDSTVNGKIPLIEGFANAAPDLTTPNTYILFTAGPYAYYGFGTFVAQHLHAKTAAVLYPQGTAYESFASAAKVALAAEGVKSTVIGYSPTSTALEGALTAAGAPSAGAVVLVGGTPASCVALNKGLNTLGVSSSKVVGDFSCGISSEKAGYGGDLPHWYFGEAQSGDSLTNSSVGVQYRKALAEFGATSNTTDVWYSGMFGVILTLAQFMNRVGYSHLSNAAMAAQAKAFRGPLLLGEPHPLCGKYPDAKPLCGGGDHFFQYLGNGKFKAIGAWDEVPCALQKRVHAKDACKYGG